MQNPIRGSLRRPRRCRTTARIVGQHHSPPPVSLGRSATQPRLRHHRPNPHELRPDHPCLHRTPHRRRNDEPRDTPLPKALRLPSRIPATPNLHGLITPIEASFWENAVPSKVRCRAAQHFVFHLESRSLRRNATVSARSAAVTPSRRPSSISDFAIQFRRHDSEIPRSRAISAIGFARSRASSTARKRNSGGCGRGISSPLRGGLRPPHRRYPENRGKVSRPHLFWQRHSK